MMAGNAEVFQDPAGDLRRERSLRPGHIGHMERPKPIVEMIYFDLFLRYSHHPPHRVHDGADRAGPVARSGQLPTQMCRLNTRWFLYGTPPTFSRSCRIWTAVSATCVRSAWTKPAWRMVFSISEYSSAFPP